MNKKTEKRGRGQPSYRITPAAQRRVSAAAGAGMSHEEIALGLGISRNTLLKHFARELSFGAYSKRLDVIEALHRAATAAKPSVAAAKTYLAMGPKVAAPPPEEVLREPKLGKKDQANRDAATAASGTTWGALLKPGAAMQ